MNAAYDFKIKFPKRNLAGRDVATVAFVFYPPPTSSMAQILGRFGYFSTPWFRIVDEIDLEGRRRQIIVFPRRR